MEIGRQTGEHQPIGLSSRHIPCQTQAWAYGRPGRGAGGHRPAFQFPFVGPDGSGGIRAESGHDSWAKEHIPGAGHADLVDDLSDKSASIRYMMPPVEQFARAMSGYGVGAGTKAVLYDSTTGSWATRIWWMLRAFGFDDAYVLNGGA